MAFIPCQGEILFPRKNPRGTLACRPKESSTLVSENKKNGNTENINQYRYRKNFNIFIKRTNWTYMINKAESQNYK